MKPIRFLTANHVLRMHYTHIFPLPLDVAAEKQTNSHRVGNPLLQPSYLESALTSPRNHHFYNGTVNPFFLVSLVAEKLALNHPFYDGNKRTALFSMDMFLRLNGVGGILVRRKDLGCRSQLRKENASVYASRSSPKLSSKERALADAMVDIATGHMQSDGLIFHGGGCRLTSPYANAIILSCTNADASVDKFMVACFSSPGITK